MIPPVECQSLDDDAWYEANITVSNSRKGNILSVELIQFPGHTEDMSLDDLEKRLRFSSEAVKDEQCGGIKPGLVVCACKKRADSVAYFTATVNDVYRGSHTNSICDCTFTVNWMRRLDEEQQPEPPETVTLSDVAFLSPRHIAEHPCFAQWREALTEASTQLRDHSPTAPKDASSNLSKGKSKTPPVSIAAFANCVEVKERQVKGTSVWARAGAPPSRPWWLMPPML
eukprot:gene23788-28838_t